MKSLKGSWNLVLAFVMANLFALSLQFASLKTYDVSVKDWVFQHPSLYALSAAVLFFIILGLDSLFNNPYFAVILSGGIIAALDLSQYHKLQILGEPFYPWDLEQLNHLSEMLKIVRNVISPTLFIIAVILLVLILLFTFRIKRPKMSLPIRVVCLSLAGFVIFFCTHLQNPVFAKPLTKMGFIDFHWNQKQNYLLNGFMIGFLENVGAKIENQPSDYSEAAVKDIVQKYETQPAVAAAGVSDNTAEAPNIVYVMDESLFDPTRLSNITFSEDPLKNFHQYQTSYATGWSLSPMFGGGTSNVEFEALSGLSMSFVNDGAVPYQQLLVKKKTFPSIVSLLKDRGYDATAIHPFDGTFYNRNQVYPVLGFDRFITQNEMTYKDTLSNYAYISDMSAAKQAVDVLNSGDQPHFIHVVTMQNHLPIMPGMNGPSTITVNGLGDSGKVEMESYLQSIKETDKALQYLVDSIQSVKRPTIVLLFGDHLPALEDATYSKGWGNLDPEKRQELMHETPLVVASNYTLPEKNLGTISPSFFGPTLFKLAGLEQPPFYKFLQQIQQQLPGVSRNVYIDQNETPQAAPTEEQQKLLHDYELLQYDLFYGKGYAQTMLK